MHLRLNGGTHSKDLIPTSPRRALRGFGGTLQELVLSDGLDNSPNCMRGEFPQARAEYSWGRVDVYGELDFFYLYVCQLALSKSPSSLVS